jgi:hypothetical protein
VLELPVVFLPLFVEASLISVKNQVMAQTTLGFYNSPVEQERYYGFDPCHQKMMA